MQHVIVERDFSKPPERVFAYLAEHENLEELFGAKVTRLKDGDDGQRNGVGSVRRLQVGPLPAFEETVIEFVPDELIRYMITKGSPLRHHHGEMRLAPAASGEGTHLRYEIAFEGKLPGLGPIVAQGLRKSITEGLEKVDANA